MRSLSLLVAGLAALGCHHDTPAQRKVREQLRDELKPVALKNCTIQRFGSANDGGYLMCANLITGVQSAYSYGIDTEDNWGCAIAKQFGVVIHQYDCFTPYRPTCDGGKFDYHDECVGPKAEQRDGKPFDTIEHQLEKNGDKDKQHLLVKIDIEGAEWDSLLATPDDVLDRIDQLPMEMHGINEEKFVQVVRKLKQHFYPVSLHFNNHVCDRGMPPLPSWAYQVLWVNKRIGVLDPSAPGRVPGSPPDAPDKPSNDDCQEFTN